MSGRQAFIPAWVAPDHAHIVDLHHLVHQLAQVVGSAEYRGQLAAVDGAPAGATSPTRPSVPIRVTVPPFGSRTPAGTGGRGMG
jgi:hypothetical protein